MRRICSPAVTDPRWEEMESWIRERVVPDDDALTRAVGRSDASGLPSIQVDPAMGKFLNLVARMTGAERILEVGTLGGYSTIWLARALPADGRLITLESDPQ
jgi:predicted O-methyltransferase YrrM